MQICLIVVIYIFIIFSSSHKILLLFITLAPNTHSLKEQSELLINSIKQN